MNKTQELVTRGIWPFIKAFFGMLWDAFKVFNQRWNEAYLLVLGFLAWKYSGVVLNWLDPEMVPLPANDLMRFLYATIGTCVAHFVVTVMLRLSHPYVFQYLYGWFYTDLYEKNENLKSYSHLTDLKCTRLKYSVLVWLSYLATWLVLVATY